MVNIWIFIFIVLSNFWIWRIFATNAWVGLLIVLASLTLNFASKWFYLLLFALLIIQVGYSKITLPWKINTYQYQIQQQRLNEYPPITWLPIAHWLEQRPEAVIFYRVKENLFEVVDINHYFFSGYPRPSSINQEFIKLPYILLPLFIVGFFTFKKYDRKIIAAFIAPVFLASIIGWNNSLGIFSFMPFLFLAIANGLNRCLQLRLLIILFLLLYAASFIQLYSYARY